MQRIEGRLLCSASDLVTFLGCHHATVLGLRNLESPIPLAIDDEGRIMLQEKGQEHERGYLESLLELHPNVVEIRTSGWVGDRCADTTVAMEGGADVIYQAVLSKGFLLGYADFLRKVLMPSRLDGFSFEVVDTKLAKFPTSKHVIQICVYSDLLAHVQGVPPRHMHLVMGTGEELSFRFEEYAHYYGVARDNFEKFCADPPDDSYPQPCPGCSDCHWREYCATQWEQDDHLSLVANIRRTQIRKLNDAGIQTVRQLAQTPPTYRLPKTTAQSLTRLREQAILQVRGRDTGKNHYDILPQEEGRGFARMPEPAPGDLFFDIEGDPLYPDGLEYLFGFHGVKDGRPWSRSFWGHDHDQERRSFEQVMDFITKHLEDHPGAHVYHYNHYESTALKRLASTYGTREAQLDNLLRNQKLVDLFKVVREALRVSEPNYSLKNMEVFYLEKRSGDVKTAGDSVVAYERWRQSGEEKLLEEIDQYNQEDCRSLRLLQEWLVRLRPKELPWRIVEVGDEEKALSWDMAEAQRELYEERLLTDCPEEERPLRQIVADMLEFHRRAAKSEWWAMFDRQDRFEEELIEDAECLGGLKSHRDIPSYVVKSSIVKMYKFPEQDFKFKVDDRCCDARTLEEAGTIAILDPEKRLVGIKRGRNNNPLPDSLSLIPAGPINTKALRGAIYRLADSVIDGDGKYQAVYDLIHRVAPRLEGYAEGQSLIQGVKPLISEALSAVEAMQSTCLFIQGPPGSGKTFTSSHIILDLMGKGYKVGVTSNSHKAIINLLQAVETRAKEQNVNFRGVKKSTLNRPESFYEGKMILNITKNWEIDFTADLFAGTAWFFSSEEFSQHLDYLFIDEAGQVAIANMVAMGLSAKNIVLVGDQMQLGQPIKGVHPGESGHSVLDYLLQGKATIPSDQGIFLPTTWRMHEDVCRFISNAVYEGRLGPEPGNQNQTLLLSPDAHPDLIPTGIRFIPANHSGCSQKSEPEGELVLELFRSLLKQRYRDRDAREHEIEVENILVVTPYNVQVNYLKSVLPTGARIGTVDKFQGQEAEVVLISMVTSSKEEMPRNLEFLYSRNRLNVALSRARCLAVIVASPKLLEIQCGTVEQMRLVNTLCWAREYSKSQ
jgi:predicted RecB family nuclease